MLFIAIVALGTVAIVVSYVRAVCSAGNPVLLETLPPLHGRAFGGTLESVSAGGTAVSLPLQSRVRLSTTDSLELRGRATDPLTSRMGAAVFAVVDDGPAFRATYVPESRTAGGRFAVVVQASELGFGAHRVRLRLVSGDRSGYYTFAAALSVVVR